MIGYCAAGPRPRSDELISRRIRERISGAVEDRLPGGRGVDEVIGGRCAGRREGVRRIGWIGSSGEGIEARNGHLPACIVQTTIKILSFSSSSYQRQFTQNTRCVIGVRPVHLN